MIKVHNLERTYRLGRKNFVKALIDVDFEIKEGEVAALIGPSGSGKSTVLNIVGGLDREYGGVVEIEGKNLKKINKDFYRRHYVQTIFQQFYLIPSLNVYENVTLPVSFGRQFRGKERRERAEMLLERVGLSSRMHHKPSELSGGQIQRVAIARALMANPKIILADEPTGNLDTKTGSEIVDMLFEINKEQGTTVLVITHDMEIIEDVKHKIFLRDGVVEKETK